MSHPARVLRAEEEALWLPLLSPEALGVDDASMFEDWRSQLRLAARTGLLQLVVAGPERGPRVVLGVTRPAPGHRALLFGLGEPDPLGVRAALALLQGEASLVTMAETAGTAWLEAALGAGLQPVTHQVFVDHLPRVADLASQTVAPGGVEPWDDGHLADLARLVADGNAGTVSGLALCQPAVPTRQAIEAHMLGLAAPGGALMREASFLVREGGRALGAVWVTLSEHGPLLYEVVVDPAARGRGLGRLLVRAAQRALLAAGHAEMRFHTTDVNAPVHRLYGPGEAEEVSSWRAAWWMGPEVLAEAAPA